MTLLDHGQPADTTTKKHRTGLIAVLAILAVALLALGAWLVIDSQQQATEQQPLSTEDQQAAIMDVVTAHRDAVNGPMEVATHDAILATFTDDATFYLSNYRDVVPREDYARQELNTDLTFTEFPVFFGDLQVAIPVRREFHGMWVNGEPVAPEVGTYIFTLREVDGQLKIATIVFNEEP